MRSFLYRNGLTIVFVSLFLATLAAQVYSGLMEHNSNLRKENLPLQNLAQYLSSGHFISATFENFQSEFLQMGLYVILTVYLKQAGSAESKRLNTREEVDREPCPGPDAPGPVNRGGWQLWLYSRSLSIAFIVLFLGSWTLHLYGSWLNNNEELQLRHEPGITPREYLSEPTFWFETFQNWQSEFLSVASIIFLSIYLRQRGSPESKPVDAPHSETGK